MHGYFPTILREKERAEQLHPDWPTDPVRGTAIMVEEAGEALRAALQFFDEGASIMALRTELIQTAAMCLRGLEHLDTYQREGK